MTHAFNSLLIAAKKKGYDVQGDWLKSFYNCDPISLEMVSAEYSEKIKEEQMNELLFIISWLNRHKKEHKKYYSPALLIEIKREIDEL